MRHLLAIIKLSSKRVRGALLLLVCVLLLGCAGAGQLLGGGESDSDQEPDNGPLSSETGETGSAPTVAADLSSPEEVSAEGGSELEEGDEGEATATIPSPAITLQEVIVTRVVEYEIPTPIVQEASEDAIVLDLSMVGGTPNTLDPQLVSTQNERDLSHNLFAGLTRFNQLTGQIEAHLARAWDVSPDGRVWTFKLRDDVYWIEPRLDGNLLNILPTTPSGVIVEPVRPIYAEDLVYAIWRACDPRTLANEAVSLYIIRGCRDVHTLDTVSEIDYARIGVRAIDSQTIQFELERPAAYFLTITSLPVMRPVPIEVVIDPELGLNEDWSLPADNILISSGPFIYSPISIMGTRVVLEPNPFWPVSRGGNVEVVNLYQFDDSVEAYELWDDLGLDITPLPAARKSEIFESEALKLMQLSEPSIFYLAYNHESEVFRIPELRRAFSAAINREEIIEEVYNDYGMPARHLSPPGVYGAPPLDRVGVGYNPDYARQQLLLGGVTACRFLPEIRYMVNSSDAALFQAELVRDMWVDELGCPEEKIVIEQVQFGELLANTRSDGSENRPDIWDLGWSGFYPDAHNWFAEVLHCTESDQRLGRACAGVDDALLSASVAHENERRRLYATIETDLFGEAGLFPVAPIYTGADYLLRQTWIDVVGNPIGNQQFHFYNLDFDSFLVDPELKRIEQAQ